MRWSSQSRRTSRTLKGIGRTGYSRSRSVQLRFQTVDPRFQTVEPSCDPACGKKNHDGVCEVTQGAENVSYVTSGMLLLLYVGAAAAPFVWQVRRSSCAQVLKTACLPATNEFVLSFVGAQLDEKLPKKKVRRTSVRIKQTNRVYQGVYWL